MKDVIERNIERLLLLDTEQEREPVEPMTEWKWKRLYKTVCRYEIGPWIADGIKAYEDDFFLQMSDALRQQFLDLQGTKEPERLERFLLEMDRAKGLSHQLSMNSLKAYANDLIDNIKNIEE